MNNTNRDYKKIISAIAFIGILCIFVGVASRIRQNRQRTLADLGPTLQSSSATDSGGADTGSSALGSTASSNSASDNSDSNSAGSNSAASNSFASNSSASGSSDVSNSVSHEATTDGAVTDITEAEYNSFFYIDNPDNTSTVYIMYYDFSHSVEKGSLVCTTDNAYDILLAFYRLYKNEYEFASIKPVTEFENEEEAKAANNTFCIDNRLFINPKYNPSISYLDDSVIVFPESSAEYSDRTKDFPYKITTDDFAYRLLIDMGFIWGGDRNGSKDYSCFTR